MSLTPGQKYYATIVAVSNTGLEATKVSDGFTVDIEPPIPGIVFDGRFLYDADYTNETTILHAQWHGFYDRHSGIDYYICCVGTTSDTSTCDVIPFHDVGLQTSVSIAIPGALQPGKYYTKVQAVDAVGHRSAVISSDGIIIDITPPDILHITSTNANLLRNPSFEEDESNFDIHCHPLWSNSTSTLPLHWKTTTVTKVAIVNSKDGEASDGNQACLLLGGIQQSVATQVGNVYAVQFSVSHPPRPPIEHALQTGKITLPGIEETFQIYPRHEVTKNNNGHPNLQSTPLSHIAWHKHLYTFVATEPKSTLRIETLARNAGLLIDAVKIELLSHSSTKGDIVVDYQQTGEWSLIQAHWQVLDLESHIDDISWAIGLVRGGTQLQGYVGVGRKSYGINTKLHLVHGMLVHVTLIVRNNAGLMSVVYAEPIVIDRTPPVIGLVSHSKDNDIGYQSGQVLIAKWDVEDDETTISHCTVAFGNSPESTDITDFKKVLFSGNPMLFNSTNHVNLKHGTKVYAIVRCFNTLGLWSQTSSTGITVISEPPDVSHALIESLPNKMSHFPCSDWIQNDIHTIRLKWDGFQKSTNHIDYYQVNIEMTNGDVNGTIYELINDGRRQITMEPLTLQQNTHYKASIKAVDMVGSVSDGVQLMFTADTNPPNKTGIRISHKWLEGTTVRFLWEGVFISDSDLYYELTIGTNPGGSDIMKWVETKQTSFTLYAVDNSFEHHLTVTAINEAGFYTSTILSFNYDN
ncbi:unnamed protein product [Owenia fusiformis]|uniref:Uncharacterized protein n=1 Tax=Owenia fusiformis TaxID=6347 RepID=A0A8S4Q7D9_OWEFU|nr:unnamed protein product [Owenia fusiformis]